MLSFSSRVRATTVFAAVLAVVVIVPRFVSSEDPKPALSEAAKNFAVEAFSAECAGCHGKDGRGKARLNLVDEVWHHDESTEDIARTIRDGVPDTKMEAHKDEFSKEDIVHLARYVKLLASLEHAKTRSRHRVDDSSRACVAASGNASPRLRCRRG